MLLTNDGDLANFIISAKNQVPKTYLLKIKGELERSDAKEAGKGGVPGGGTAQSLRHRAGENDQLAAIPG